MKRSIYFLIVLIAAVLSSCRKDASVSPEVPIPVDPSSGLSFYLVNEGNWNGNNSSLDFYDSKTGIYRRNIFEQANPEVTLGMGDTGNDIGIYGSKVYIVMNASNKLIVLNKKTQRQLAQVAIPNGRYVTFHKGKAYVSSYETIDGKRNNPLGSVARIDTTSFAVEKVVNVGRQPEEMAIVNDKLYIANSGGYDPDNYERTVSVIDLNTFTELKKIDVAINLHRLKADKYGDLYVSSRGDYGDIPSRLFAIDTKTDAVKKVFDIGVSNLCIDDDLAYTYQTEWSNISQTYEISYNLIDIKEEKFLDKSFLKDDVSRKIETPYCIAVDPISKNIYLTDARSYTSPGRLLCFDKEGILKWSVVCGMLPAQIAFLNLNQK